MAAAHSNLGGSIESSLQSQDSVRSDESRVRSTGPMASWESELTSIQHALKFVLALKDEFVLSRLQRRRRRHHPVQFVRWTAPWLHQLRSVPEHPPLHTHTHMLLPDWSSLCRCSRITAGKREISNLEVYCTNLPACTSVVTLAPPAGPVRFISVVARSVRTARDRLCFSIQDHLSSCPYEQLQCFNVGCRAALQRRHLQEHLSSTCPHRTEPCPHCQQPLPLSLLQDHVLTSCPDVEVDCPSSCSQKLPRHKLKEHRDSCPEVQVSCSYKRFGCCVQGQRARVKLHEDAAVNHHMLLVLKSNTHLEQQVEVLQEEVLQRQQKVQTDSSLLDRLQQEVRPLLQRTSNHERIIGTAQLEVQRVSRTLGPGLEELEQLRKSLDAVIQEVSETEALKEHLGTLEESLKRHSGLLDLHAAQLHRNKEHLQELEATSYDGRLIWKIDDFRKRRDAEVRGQPPCLSSVPFHSGRCGYKMAAKVYLNGDGEGRGTHLSLYVVLMPGDFDALLPWPFRQTVSLSVLDQSGAANHRTLSFKPDPMSKSFQRPGAESVSNIAVGFSCFIPLNKLEAPHNATYVSDDTLFVKVKVDTAGLEQL
ncbi:TNF receptor-associated factor 5 [Nibea albiflora]|uniref:TNF receptor-associated factor 5 n=1 Tax=Nibea albiflora TaxID=240163 RepID=A0ACB7FKE4_NIBAL|nr:TNF receptor-associated factor 5 [Nibea albiflora]